MVPARIYPHVVALVLITVMTGGHWALLQSIAWTRMLIDYTRQGDLVSGIQNTFDGEHPCEMCKAIRKAKSQTEESQAGAIRSPGSLRMDAIPWAGLSYVRASVRFIGFDGMGLPPPEGMDIEPPVPPPRDLTA